MDIMKTIGSCFWTILLVILPGLYCNAQSCQVDCDYKPEIRKLNCEGLDISCIPKPCCLKGTRHLNLANNNINRLPQSSFTRFPNLRALDLSDNNIGHIVPGAFLGLMSLTTLDIRGNQLNRLKAASFTGMPNLRHLNLADNSITHVDPGAFIGLPMLMYLKLNDNELHKLKPGMFEPLRNLLELQLQNNQIDSMVNGALYGLKKLKVMSLAENELTTVPELLTKMPNLRTIYLDGNPLTCDCRVEHLRRWLLRRQDSIKEPPRCAAPPRLRNRDISTLSTPLTCRDSIEPDQSEETAKPSKPAGTPEIPEGRPTVDGADGTPSSAPNRGGTLGNDLPYFSGSKPTRGDGPSGKPTVADEGADHGGSTQPSPGGNDNGQRPSRPTRPGTDHDLHPLPRATAKPDVTQSSASRPFVPETSPTEESIDVSATTSDGTTEPDATAPDNVPNAGGHVFTFDGFPPDVHPDYELTFDGILTEIIPPNRKPPEERPPRGDPLPPVESPTSNIPIYTESELPTEETSTHELPADPTNGNGEIPTTDLMVSDPRSESPSNGNGIPSVGGGKPFDGMPIVPDFGEIPGRPFDGIPFDGNPSYGNERPTENVPTFNGNGNPFDGIPVDGHPSYGNERPTEGAPSTGNGRPFGGRPFGGSGKPFDGIPVDGNPSYGNERPTEGVPTAGSGRPFIGSGRPFEGIPVDGNPNFGNAPPTEGILTSGNESPTDGSPTLGNGNPSNPSYGNERPVEEYPTLGRPSDGNPSLGNERPIGEPNAYPSNGWPSFGHGRPFDGVPDPGFNGGDEHPTTDGNEHPTDNPSNGNPDRPTNVNPSNGPTPDGRYPVLPDGRTENGIPPNGRPNNGIPTNGRPNNGIPTNGRPNNGIPTNGRPNNGIPTNGRPNNGIPTNGRPNNGIPTNGRPNNGIPTNGRPNNGIPTNGRPNNGIPTNGRPNNGIPTNGRPNNGIPTNGRPDIGIPPNGRPNNRFPPNSNPNGGVHPGYESPTAGNPPNESPSGSPFPDIPTSGVPPAGLPPQAWGLRGRKMHLDCGNEVPKSARSGSRVKWLTPSGGVINQKARGRFVVAANGSLVVARLQGADTGAYRCIIRNDTTTRISLIRLQVACPCGIVERNGNADAEVGFGTTIEPPNVTPELRAKRACNITPVVVAVVTTFQATVALCSVVFCLWYSRCGNREQWKSRVNAAEQHSNVNTVDKAKEASLPSSWRSHSYEAVCSTLDTNSSRSTSATDSISSSCDHMNSLNEYENSNVMRHYSEDYVDLDPQSRTPDDTYSSLTRQSRRAAAAAVANRNKNKSLSNTSST